MDIKYLVILISLLILTLIFSYYSIFFRKSLDESVETESQKENEIGDEVAEAVANGNIKTDKEKVSSNDKLLYSPRIQKKISNTSLDNLIKIMKSLKQSGVIYKGKDNYEARIISTAIVVFCFYNFFSNKELAVYLFNDSKRNREVEPFKQIIYDLLAFLIIRRKQGEQRDLIDSLAKRYDSFIDFLPSTNASYSECVSITDLYIDFKYVFRDFEKYLVFKEKIKTDRNETVEVETCKIVLYNIRKGLLKYGKKNQ